MSTGYEAYRALIMKFLARQISPLEFQDAFFARFRNENSPMDEALFLLLDELFGILDCYTKDAALLTFKPGFYLDTQALEREAADILRRLNLITDPSSHTAAKAEFTGT